MPDSSVDIIVIVKFTEIGYSIVDIFDEFYDFSGKKFFC